MERRPVEAESDMTPVPAPPALAEALVAALLADAHVREAVLGDLAEDYQLLAGESPARAARWYWSQLVRSAIPFALMSVIGTGWRGWMRLGWAILAGYACLAMLVVLTNLLVQGLLPYRPGDFAMPAASLAFGVGCAIAAGYVPPRIRPPAPIAPACALGIAAALLSAGSLAAGGDGSPLWYQIGLMAVVLPAVVAGASVRAWRHGRRNRFKDGD